MKIIPSQNFKTDTNIVLKLLTMWPTVRSFQFLDIILTDHCDCP